MTAQEKYKVWLDSPAINDATKSELAKMSDDEIVDAFYKDLEFGTGGLRGIMGAGTNRINKYTVGMATQGLSNYLKAQFQDQEIKVAIAHDSRNNSRSFAEITANVFTANGIQAYLFEDLRPTPQLSFAIRELGCQGGVVLTASHNPREYNGYKAYWADGGQLISPHDKGVISEVRAISGFDKVNFEGESSDIRQLGKEMDEKYLGAIKKLSLDEGFSKDLKIVFSPIHGTGITLVPKVLTDFGFENVQVVEEQSNPDGNFPTVIYPNPEEEEAMSLGLQKARELDADVLMATDPDADRVGLGVKNLYGEFQLLNGNQAASLLIYYLLSRKAAIGLKGNEFIAKTIVTTDLLVDIADSFGIKTYETLTGFKYIADLILKKEGSEKFIGGGEESYGYLIGDAVRDKDAVASCALLAEAISWAKTNGNTAFQLLIEIYVKFGFYGERLHSITKKGQAGAEEIEEMMRSFRESPPTSLAGSQLMKVLDYKDGTSRNLRDGTTSQMDFPSSNVLQFVTQDGSKVSIRPSGTEPKIKFYFSTKMTLPSEDAFAETQKSLENKLDSLMQDLGV